MREKICIPIEIVRSFVQDPLAPHKLHTVTVTVTGYFSKQRIRKEKEQPILNPLTCTDSPWYTQIRRVLHCEAAYMLRVVFIQRPFALFQNCTDEDRATHKLPTLQFITQRHLTTLHFRHINTCTYISFKSRCATGGPRTASSCSPLSRPRLPPLPRAHAAHP
jgi:hypothetical protein